MSIRGPVGTVMVKFPTKVRDLTGKQMFVMRASRPTQETWYSESALPAARQGRGHTIPSKGAATVIRVSKFPLTFITHG